MKYYSIERRNREHVLNSFKQFCPGKKVLDYCCGNGEDSIEMAQAGAREVIGVDISEISIENCTRLAEKNGFGSICTFTEADAENLPFPDNSFDFVSEYGSLQPLTTG